MGDVVRINSAAVGTSSGGYVRVHGSCVGTYEVKGGTAYAYCSGVCEGTVEANGNIRVNSSCVGTTDGSYIRVNGSCVGTYDGNDVYAAGAAFLLIDDFRDQPPDPPRKQAGGSGGGPEVPDAVAIGCGLLVLVAWFYYWLFRAVWWISKGIWQLASRYKYGREVLICVLAVLGLSGFIYGGSQGYRALNAVNDSVAADSTLVNAGLPSVPPDEAPQRRPTAAFQAQTVRPIQPKRPPTIKPTPRPSEPIPKANVILPLEARASETFDLRKQPGSAIGAVENYNYASTTVVRWTRLMLTEIQGDWGYVTTPAGAKGWVELDNLVCGELSR